MEHSPKRTGVPGLIQESIERDLENLKQLRNSLDPAKVINVAKRISSARSVLILAGDMVASLGKYSDTRFRWCARTWSSQSRPGKWCIACGSWTSVTWSSPSPIAEACAKRWKLWRPQRKLAAFAWESAVGFSAVG